MSNKKRGNGKSGFWMQAKEKMDKLGMNQSKLARKANVNRTVIVNRQYLV